MQSFFDSARQMLDQAAFERDKRTRIGRVQKQIDELNRQIAAAVSQLGSKAVELYRQNQLPVAALHPLCQAVLNLEGQIGGLQTQIAAIQQEVMPQAAMACSYCRAPVTVGARFCANCGQPVAASPVQPGPTCPHCGMPTVIGAAFCGDCGYRLIPAELQPSVPVPPPVVAPADVTPAPSPAPPPIGGQAMPPAVAPQPEPSPLPLPDAQPTDVSAPGSPALSQPSAAETSQASPPGPAPVPETIPAPLACPLCGAQQRRADARFCRVCGKPIPAPSAAPASAQPVDTSQADSAQQPAG